MATLAPADFNKPCLMTYGEIAERIAYWSAETKWGGPRSKPDGDLGSFTRLDDESRHDHALRVTGGLLKLSTEDVR